MPARDRVGQQRHVLDTAETLFLDYGYVSTTMGHIADAIHVSRPALYLLYPSRDAIFAALAEPQAPPGAAIQDEDLSAWLERVLDLWLGSASGRRDGARDRQRPAVTLKQQALLCSVLKDGLARRIGGQVGEDFQNAIVQLIALCVRGLQDAQLDARQGKALLNMQVNALATMATSPRNRMTAWNDDVRQLGSGPS